MNHAQAVCSPFSGAPHPLPAGARPTPWMSVALSALAVALYASATLSERFAYDRNSIAAGEVWRLLTGHFTHWTAEHLGWDLLVFAVLAVLWERSGARRRLAACVFGSALLISAAVWAAMPETTLYRGLSGIDCSLVTATAVSLLRRSLRRGQRGLSVAFAVVLAGYFLKILYESATGGTVFVEADAFVAVPLAHLVGGLYGAFVGTYQKTTLRRE